MSLAPPEPSSPAFFSTDVSAARRFYLNLKTTPTKGLRVVCGGSEHCVPNYEVQRSGFPYLSIEFIARGKGHLTLDGNEFALIPGTVFSYGPGIAHQITTDPADPLIKYFVDFVGTAAQRFLKEAHLPPGTCMQVDSPGRVQDVFDDIIRNGLSPRPVTPRICAILVEYLILNIGEKAALQRSANSRACATYERCRRIIDEHFLEVRTLDQIAERCNVDKAYLCRLFQKFDHQSPYQKLLRLQMANAADQLQHSGRLVKEVANELGWDPFHFSRVFKKTCGVSPERFVKLSGRG